VDGWFDSHCHVQEDFDPESGALSRAWEAGVDRLVCVGTNVETSRQALLLAEEARSGAHGPNCPSIWSTVGLHPHEASTGAQCVAELLDEGTGVAEGLVVAIGECGLDYYYDHSPRDQQRRAFADQIALAHERGLALVVHARDAWADLFDTLVAEGTPERSVLHCFTGGLEEARRCLDMGMYISFSGIVTFKNAEPVREAAAFCPLDRLLVETDSPFLAPAPHRGRPNEPGYLPLVGAAIASLKGLDSEDLAESSANSAQVAFGLSGREQPPIEVAVPPTPT